MTHQKHKIWLHRMANQLLQFEMSRMVTYSMSYNGNQKQHLRIEKRSCQVQVSRYCCYFIKAYPHQALRTSKKPVMIWTIVTITCFLQTQSLVKKCHKSSDSRYNTQKHQKVYPPSSSGSPFSNSKYSDHNQSHYIDSKT